jgi:hypothetical protein
MYGARESTTQQPRKPNGGDSQTTLNQILTPCPTYLTIKSPGMMSVQTLNGRPQVDYIGYVELPPMLNYPDFGQDLVCWGQFAPPFSSFH